MSAHDPSTGTIHHFLRTLRATGSPVIRLTGSGPWSGVLTALEAEAHADPQLAALLKSWHQEASEDLGGPPLEFDLTAARLGAILLFRAAWCYLHRDSTAAEAAALLSADPAPAATPSSQFSADLALQHLPGVFRLAQALAPGDPLLAGLRHLAARFPLSSPGIPPEEHASPAADPAAWAALRSHSGLHQLFLDRTVQCRTPGWLAVPHVAAALRRSLGSYPGELAPTLPPVPDLPTS